MPWVNPGPQKRIVPLPSGELTPCTLVPSFLHPPSCADTSPRLSLPHYPVRHNAPTPGLPSGPGTYFCHSPVPSYPAGDVPAPFPYPFPGQNMAPVPNYSIYLSIFPDLSLAPLCGDRLGNSGRAPAPFADPGPELTPYFLPQLFPAGPFMNMLGSLSAEREKK